MHARVSTLQGSPDRVDSAIEQFRSGLEALRDAPGHRGAILLVDRSSGKGVAVTLWEDEQRLQESRERANQLRQQAAEQAQGEILGVDEYEVAAWDLS